MQHLTAADYRRQPWKNGKGETLELWRLERDGVLLARLSRASVVEDGPFSLFPGVDRCLTVLTGTGFRLRGEGVDLECKPLVPVEFPGDVAVSALGTGGLPSDDFNVMVARGLARAEVWLAEGGALAAGGLLAVYALEAAEVQGYALAAGEMLLGETAMQVAGRVLAVRLSL